MMKHYGILVIGSGKKKRYAPVEILPDGRGTNPVGYCKTYRTVEQAEAAAAAYGLDVERVGDFYTLIAD